MVLFFFQAEDGIRDLVRSRGLGDVYKRQARQRVLARALEARDRRAHHRERDAHARVVEARQRAAQALHLSLIHI